MSSLCLHFKESQHIYAYNKKEYSQLEVIFARTVGLIQGNFLMKPCSAKTAVLKVFPQQCFFGIFSKVLEQNLKWYFLKIMSYHIIQLIRVTQRYLKQSAQFLCFLPYINTNHKDSMHPTGYFFTVSVIILIN